MGWDRQRWGEDGKEVSTKEEKIYIHGSHHLSLGMEGGGGL